MPTVRNETRNRPTSVKTAAATLARQVTKTQNLAEDLRKRFTFLDDMWMRVLFRVCGQELERRGIDPFEELQR